MEIDRAEQNNLEILNLYPSLGLAAVKVASNRYSLFAQEEFEFEKIAFVSPIDHIISSSATQNDNWGKKYLFGNREPEFSGLGVTIAILDSGIDSSHEKLSSAVDPISITTTFNGEIIEQDIPPNDTGFHGSHVASIIGGKMGIAPNCRLRSVQVLNGESGTLPQCIAGMEYVARTPEIKIVNLSFEITGTSRSINIGVQKLISQGKIVVAAAGNQGPGIVSSPACCPNVISVSAIDREDLVWGGSNGGTARWPNNILVDVPLFSAPGIEIPGASSGGGIKVLSGTSQASPHVTGLIALMAQRRDNISQSIAIETLKNHSIDLLPNGFDLRSGFGRVVPPQELFTST